MSEGNNQVDPTRLSVEQAAKLLVSRLPRTHRAREDPTRPTRRCAGERRWNDQPRALQRMASKGDGTWRVIQGN